MSFNTPQAYARHLATYIASPTKIEAYTRLEFGDAPPLHMIANMRLEVEASGKPYRNARRELRAVERENTVKPRTYNNSGTVYFPAHVTLPAELKIAPVATRSHKEVVTAVADAFGLSYEDLTGVRRFTQLVCARSVAVKILRERGNTLPQIGRYLGGRDHSTIHNLLVKYADRAARHPQMVTVYERLSTSEQVAA